VWIFIGINNQHPHFTTSKIRTYAFYPWLPKRPGKVFRIGTVRYNWPMSAHASQAFSIAHCTDSRRFAKTGTEPFRSGANSLPRANRPIGPWPIRSQELSLLGPFAPWPFCSVANSFPGTFAPKPFHSPVFSLPGTKVLWNFCSVELSFPGTLAPLMCISPFIFAVLILFSRN